MGPTAAAHVPGPRQRDVLPLPASSFEIPVLKDASLSHSVRQRLSKVRRAAVMSREVALALNEIHDGKSPSWSHCPPNATQRSACDHIGQCVRAMGEPPEDLHGPEALRALWAKAGYQEESGTIAPLDVEKLSLPSPERAPVPLEEVGGEAGSQIVQRVLLKRIPCKEIVSGRIEQSGIRRPYVDPGLRNPQRYAGLVVALLERGLLEFHERSVCQTGVFAVWKKNGKQRLILDARWSNLNFEGPDDVRLATGQSFGALEVDQGSPVCLGQVDIADAFYTLLLPKELRTLFGFPSIAAKHIPRKHWPSWASSGGVKLSPCFRAVPMGWTLALNICQEIHEIVARRVPMISLDNRMVDREPPPRMAQVGLVHTEYVDNFVALAQDERTCAAAAQGVQEQLEQAGLPTHGTEVTKGGTTLGWDFHEDAPVLGVNPRTAWKIRLGCLELLKRGRCSGNQLRII
eukprot:3032700-Amphidinium_carterae.1